MAVVFLATASGLFALKLPFWIVLAISYVASVSIALFVGGIATRKNPDLRFSTESRVVGLGYLHQPIDVIMTVGIMTLLSFGSMAVMRACAPQHAEQGGTGQPATRPESKSEGSDKPQSEAEGRSR